MTLRIKGGLPNLRGRAYRAVRSALAIAANRLGVRITDWCVQRNHLHLIVEAGDERSLGQAMKGLAVRVARRVNRRWKRRGTVFPHRYHAEVLRTPTQMRNALLYVLNNSRKHAWQRGEGAPHDQHDPWSSSLAFDGWHDAPTGPDPPDSVGCAPPRSWLRSHGWRERGGGPLSIYAVPGVDKPQLKA